MISTDKLTEMYNKWGDEQNLQPLGCAFEERYFHEGNKYNEQQLLWLERFIRIWEYSQDKEDNK
jgi:hypothetical protein